MVPTAINKSPLPPEMLDAIAPYVPACRMMGRLLLQVLGGTPKLLRVELAGGLASSDPALLVSGVLDGMLTDRKAADVTTPDTVSIASRYGIHVETAAESDAQEYASAVRVTADGVEVASTLFGLDQTARIVSLLDYKIDIVPASHSLVMEYDDAPGRIGTIGTILGAAGVNITTMQIGTKPADGRAMVYINVEGEVPDAVLDELRDAIDLKSLWRIVL